jgi:hypothetical protein
VCVCGVCVCVVFVSVRLCACMCVCVCFQFWLQDHVRATRIASEVSNASHQTVVSLFITCNDHSEMMCFLPLKDIA